MRETMLGRAAALIGAAVFACVVPAVSATPAAAADSAYLRGGERLDPGASLTSGRSRLVMQHDGNLVLYRKRDGAALWSTGTYGHPGAVTTVSSTGELRVFESRGAGTFFSNHITNRTGAQPKVQADGNFVIYDGQGRAVWATGTYGNW